MTTIAYKAGEIASDSCIASGHGIRSASVVKIVRLSSGALLGEAGDADSRDIIALLDKVRSYEKLPRRAELAALRINYAGILVLPRGKVYYIEVEPLGEDWHHFDAQITEANLGYAAVGSGADLALGAMAAGKSAKEAVRIACIFDINSRLPVHTMSLIETVVKQKGAKRATGSKSV